jgi:hypothetical protein
MITREGIANIVYVRFVIAFLVVPIDIVKRLITTFLASTIVSTMTVLILPYYINWITKFEKHQSRNLGSRNNLNDIGRQLRYLKCMRGKVGISKNTGGLRYSFQLFWMQISHLQFLFLLNAIFHSLYLSGLFPSPLWLS